MPSQTIRAGAQFLFDVTTYHVQRKRHLYIRSYTLPNPSTYTRTHYLILVPYPIIYVCVVDFMRQTLHLAPRGGVWLVLEGEP